MKIKKIRLLFTLSLLIVVVMDLPGLINNVSPFVIIIIAHFEVLSLCLLHFLSMVKFQGVLLALH